MFKLAFVAVCVVCFHSTYGFRHLRRQIPNGYNVMHPCPGKGIWEAVGHMQPYHVMQKNKFGLAMKKARLNWSAICNEDSDGDGLTNGAELGDPRCKWRPGDPDPGPVLGHPGFCEPDRNQCTGGLRHRECLNHTANQGHGHGNGHGQGHGRGQGRGNVIIVPPEANHHPNSLYTKDIARRQGLQSSQFGTRGANRGAFGQSQPGFGQPRPGLQMFGQPQSGMGSLATQFRSYPPRIGMQQPQQQTSHQIGQSIFGDQPNQSNSPSQQGSQFGIQMSGVGMTASPISPATVQSVGSWTSDQSSNIWSSQGQQTAVVDPNMGMLSAHHNQRTIQGTGRMSGFAPRRPTSFMSMFPGQGQVQTSLNQEQFRRNVQSRINRERARAASRRPGSFAGRISGGVSSSGGARPTFQFRRPHGFRMYP